MRAAQTQTYRDEAGPTLRDLARLCTSRRYLGNYFIVTTEAGHKYRVDTAYVGGDFEARCQCPIRTFRLRQCRHELRVMMDERARVAGAQGF